MSERAPATWADQVTVVARCPARPFSAQAARARRGVAGQQAILEWVDLAVAAVASEPKASAKPMPAEAKTA